MYVFAEDCFRHGVIQFGIDSSTLRPQCRSVLSKCILVLESVRSSAFTFSSTSTWHVEASVCSACSRGHEWTAGNNTKSKIFNSMRHVSWRFAFHPPRQSRIWHPVFRDISLLSLVFLFFRCSTLPLRTHRAIQPARGSAVSCSMTASSSMTRSA